MWSLRSSRPEIQAASMEMVLRWNRQGVSLLTGTSGIFYLSHLWQFALIRHGFSVHTVDCAIRFDAYAIAEEALRNSISPEDIHDSITVSRCFTPYQILDEMISLLKSPEENKVYFILAPSKQFFDGDVADDEGAFLLKKLSGVFEDFQKKSIPLMIVEKDSYTHPAFLPFINHAREISRPLFQLHSEEKKLERRLKKLYSVRVAGLIKESA